MISILSVNQSFVYTADKSKYETLFFWVGGSRFLKQQLVTRLIALLQLENFMYVVIHFLINCRGTTEEL